MSLPKWIEELKIGNNAGRAYDALEIAWEALEEITNKRCELYHGDNAADAMRRIEEMGK